MRPLPKVFLKDTVQYYELDEDSGRYEPSFKDPVIIKNVLINYYMSVKKSNPANEEKTNAGSKMYMDVANTKPLIPNLVYGSKIVDQSGNTFYVKGVKPIQAFTVHHYEVDLQ